MTNETKRPHTWLVMRLNDPNEGPLIQEGELDPMNWPQTQRDGQPFPTMQQVLGDEKARSNISYSLSLKDFGNGGEIHVSLSLTHGQDPSSTYWAQEGAAELVKTKAFELIDDLRTRLVARGVLKP